MLPSADEVLASWPFLARRLGLAGEPSRPQVEAALRLAAECAGERETDEPAALFYGLARYPRAFPGAWRTIGERVARVHAARLGFDLHASADEVNALRLAVAKGEADCEAAKVWFRARALPL